MAPAAARVDRFCKSRFAFEEEVRVRDEFIEALSKLEGEVGPTIPAQKLNYCSRIRFCLSDNAANQGFALIGGGAAALHNPERPLGLMEQFIQKRRNLCRGSVSPFIH